MVLAEQEGKPELSSTFDDDDDDDFNCSNYSDDSFTAGDSKDSQKATKKNPFALFE